MNNLDETILRMISSAQTIKRRTFNKNYIIRRSNIISNLKSFINRFNLNNTVYYSAIGLIDTLSSDFFYINDVIVVIACCMLSAKFHTKCRIPKYRDVSSVYKLSTSDLIKMELIVLKHLGYNLSEINSFYILESLICVFNSDHITAFKIYNFFIEDERFLDFNAMEIACATIALTREISNFEPWPVNFSKSLGVKLNKFMNCYIVIQRYHTLTKFV
jgi:hypothetical protein